KLADWARLPSINTGKHPNKHSKYLIIWLRVIVFSFYKQYIAGLLSVIIQTYLIHFLNLSGLV
ncbi:hypothetical protein, partial [Arsenicibacter rosenii]|uniref:hypothetical protein n=1 Tax=Arsenicibacter rosenii TaxID=1750698 RepID=UPI001C42E73E